MTKKDFKKNVAEQFLSGAVEEQAEANKAADPKASLAIPEGYKLVKETKSQRMQLLIRPTLKAAIRQEAEAQGLSMNDLVNNIFEEYLERNGK